MILLCKLASKRGIAKIPSNRSEIFLTLIHRIGQDFELLYNFTLREAYIFDNVELLSYIACGSHFAESFLLICTVCSLHLAASCFYCFCSAYGLQKNPCAAVLAMHIACATQIFTSLHEIKDEEW